VRQILIDTGPLVALLDADDRDYARCVRAARRLSDDLLTTWPVLTEAMYLLSHAPKAQDALLAKIEEGTVQTAVLDADDAREMRALMKKYRDLPMDFADASLVRVADREGIKQVFTLDRRDFGVYQTTPGRPFVIVP
jgi:predicted nucleic acid-binding protein